MFDVLITLAEKDFLKLRFVTESIYKNIYGVDHIYCVSNKKVPKEMVVSDVTYFLDDDVVDFNFDRFTDVIKRRKGWYVQQYIKLFQDITADEYLVVDSDVYFNRKVDIIKNHKPTFLFGTDQNHPPYFHFMKDLFDLERVYPFSFINEVMFFKWDIIKHMLDSLGINKYGFFELSVNELNKSNNASGFSEYELYGNYTTKYFPDAYNYTYVKTVAKARKSIWSVEEMRKYIDTFKDKDIDIIKMHTWI